MEADCRRTTDSLRFRLPCTPHAVAVMVMALTFNTEYPDEVGDALNIFLFPDLSPLEGLEAALLTRKWDTILGGRNLNFLHRHKSDDRKAKGRPHHRLVRVRVPT